MEHTRAPPDLGRKGPGTAAAAAVSLGGVPGRKGAASSSSPIGRGSASPAGLFLDGRGTGSPAGLFIDGRRTDSPAGLFSDSCGSGSVARVGRGSRPAASLFPTGGGNGTASGFTSGFPFPASSSPASWESAGTSPTWDKDTYPPGGFMRYFENQAHNFHLVGGPSHSSHENFSPPETNVGRSPSNVGTLDKQPAVVDRDNENVRTEKRILWTAKEDERLMSAWIEHSTDSTLGADRKGEAYWGDVINAYNKNTAPQRARNAKQAKDRWHKINKWCDLFECAYLKALRVYTSGYSNQMWLDVADDFYVEDSKDDEGKPVLGPFMLKNVWKICREEPKWKTYNEGLKNARKRKSYHLEAEGEENDDSVDETPKRPIGQKAAKKAALAAKGKSKEMDGDGKSKSSAIDVDKVDRLGKIQECANADCIKILELQKKLSSDKVETTKLAHLTAQENRESEKLEMEGKKLEKESKMMDAYNSLISQDTSSMTGDEKAERVAAMKCLRKMLFPELI